MKQPQQLNRVDPARAEASSPSSPVTFPVVGIGASAGGLAAFERFFDALPERPGMAFVIVQHLDPTHESSLADLLQNHTAMPVEQVENRTVVEAGHVYVIPPGKQLSIHNSTLYLSDPDRPRGQRALIDVFFRSLAEDQGERAICVILSGTGSDGSVGLKSIKERGGAVLVQEPDDAGYDGMPTSALASGLVDLTAPAGLLAEKLMAYHQSADRIQLPEGGGRLPALESDVLQRILAQLKTQTGHDFSNYKRKTILRRLKRRMQVAEVEDMPAYLGVLRSSPQEAQALMKDFLISVTNFFRDAEAFAALERMVIPQLFEARREDHPVRVWVPGCATGEEAYSVAMLLSEQTRSRRGAVPLQVFASDIDDEALDYARAGRYPDVIAADVSAARLNRYFQEESRGYRVKETVRDVVLFAQHNLLRDPPFSKLDLISCRNLLIYLERDIQEGVFELFHYALRDDGFLFLGGSETADGVPSMFRPVSKKHRIYRRKPGPTRLSLPSAMRGAVTDKRNDEADRARTQRSALGEVHQELMLHAYAPPSVIVDEHYEICYLFGDVGRYLRPVEGEPSHNLLRMVPPVLRIELRAALFQVFKKGQESATRRVRSLQDEREENVELIVRPVRHDEVREPLALVIFEPLPDPVPHGEGTSAEAQRYDEEVVEQLEEELRRTKHRLETVIEEYETSNEELKSSNEELQSMNEELRSTSEELETSREELQSTNEELETVNAELRAKVSEVNRANSDLENLMASTQIGTLFLDADLCLMRFTPSATQLFNVIASDIGRPFDHVSHKIDHKDLPAMAERVLRTLEPMEEEIRGREGGWFIMRIVPYRTVDDRIDGVVVTFVDITERKEVQDEERERARHQAVVAELRQHALQESNPQTLMNLAVRQVAQCLDVPFCKALELVPDRNELVLRAGVGWAEGAVGTATEGTGDDSPAGFTLKANGPIVVRNVSEDRRFAVPSLLADHGVVSGVSVVLQGAAQPFGVLGAYTDSERAFSDEDVHFVQSVANVLGTTIERHRHEGALRESREQLAALNEELEARVRARTRQVRTLASSLTLAEQRERHRVAQILHDDLQQLLYGAQVQLGMAERLVADGQDELAERMRAVVDIIVRAIDVARTLTVDLSPPVLEGEGLAEALQWLASQMREIHGLEVDVRADQPMPVDDKEMRVLLFNLVRELLFNVVKHAGVGDARVVLQRNDGAIRVEVEDDGAGFDQKEVFAGEDSDSGFGLFSVHERLALFGGRLEIDAAPGRGTRATITVPVAKPRERPDQTVGSL